jgi:signal transduction histidine kinase/CHASE3 domain sensor protein
MHDVSPTPDTNTQSPFPAEEKLGAVQAIAIFIIALGLSVLAGWVWNIGVLKSPFTGMIVMKVNAATTFVLSGICLYLHTLHRPSPPSLLFRRLGAVLVLLIGLVTLSEDFFGWDAGIDQLLFSEPAGAALTPHPGRMAVIAATNFVLMGGALLLLEARLWMAVQAVAFAVAAFALLSLGGYMLGSLSFTRIGNTTAIAVHAAMGFLALPIGILMATRHHGIMPQLKKKSQTLGLVASLAMLISIFGAASYNFVQKDKTSQWVEHTYEVIVAIKSFSASLADFLYHNRGFLITGDERQLLERDNSRNAMLVVLDKVRQLTTDNPEQQVRLRALDKLVQQRVERANLAIQVRREKGVEASTALLASGKGDTILVEIEAKLDELENAENNLLKERQRTAQVMRSSSLFTLGIMATTSLLLLLWVFRASRREIAERKLAEKELREKEERLALATLQNGVGVWDWNLITQQMVWDDSMYALYRIRREDFIGTEEAWRAALHPDDLHRGDREVNDAIAGIKPFNTEFRVVWPNGEIHHIKAVAKVFRDEKGTPLRMLGINMDITASKQLEEKINELNRSLELRVTERTAQLEAANKDMESFSYSISHDLRAPLRAINGFSKILQEDYAVQLDDEGRRLLNVVGNNAQKMGQLIDDILAFSRAGRNEIEHTTIDMKKLVTGVWEELKPDMAGRDIHLELRDLPPAGGDAAMMHQVVFNLLSNAVKFTRHNAGARIEVGVQTSEHETIYHVKDNGAGFDMQYADKLFGVFLRLHGMDEFEGTGIGLAIVKRIIAKHGGRVWAEGKVNEGATFYFALPKR